jgi:hypothetical protein
MRPPLGDGEPPVRWGEETPDPGLAVCLRTPAEIVQQAHRAAQLAARALASA